MTGDPQVRSDAAGTVSRPKQPKQPKQQAASATPQRARSLKGLDLRGSSDAVGDLRRFVLELKPGRAKPADKARRIVAYRRPVAMSPESLEKWCAAYERALEEKPALEGPAIDLDLLALHPVELLETVLGAESAAQVIGRPDGVARLRVAATRHLWVRELKGQPAPVSSGGGARRRAERVLGALAGRGPEKDGSTSPVPQSEVASLVPACDAGADVAVIIPCHDDGHFVLDALASVRLCSLERFDVVVVDDGSTDPVTLTVLAQLESAGVRVAHQDAAGVSSARNLGVQLTTAPFLVNLDADNLLRPGFVTSALAVLREDKGIAAVHADVNRFGIRRDPWPAPEHDPVRLLSGNYLDTFALLRRNALVEVGGWDERLRQGEDWELWLALTEAGWHFARVPLVGLDYRVRKGSLRSGLDDPEVSVAVAVAVARKHRALFAAYAPQVVGNYMAALAARPPDAPGSEVSERPERSIHQLTDQLAAARAEITRLVQVSKAVQARSAVRDPSAMARERVTQAEERAVTAEAELARLQATRMYRWSRWPRVIYRWLHLPGP